MTDYAYAQIIARLADNPEFDPLHDKVLMTFSGSETDGYAREDNRFILAAAQTIDLDLDAFKDEDWVNIAVQNEGPNEATLSIVDDVGAISAIPFEAGACLLVRCYKQVPKPGGAPALSTTLGAKVRVFAWGENWAGEPQ